ncbi:methyltransferase domain-containing protein [Streptomyces sp. SCUT-3]|uniref:class I SAM-dependent methyltransferase n=1 Tax=Streptomyces sp. SCUT-3 TaxID=2684469 RepID=UPI0015F7E7D2|nr:class I SAM-dependent methyltransferase [Streptomyces sp. SCUT-3]QMV24310.1 methyltransferase domain-containing protein [Streptomyces sp. SCUT-3]
MDQETPARRVRRIWERIAPSYDRWMRCDRLLVGDSRRWVCSRASGRTLEVAVGTGLNLPLYPPGTEVVGLDLSRAMLEHACGRTARAGLRAQLVEGSAERLPFADACFDTVVSTLALCSVPDDRAAVAEMHRVLRPGGRLLLLDHVAGSGRAVRAAQRGLERLTWRWCGDRMTRRPLALVLASGFTVERRDRFRAGVVERLSATKPGGPAREA